MNAITTLIMRRMRTPLIVLICAYTVAIIGMMSVPGVDDKGQIWYMDLFHALYFISYTATTIGFGEIPYPLSNGQRLWVLFSIYISVIAWFYSIGAIIALVQEPALKRARIESRFQRAVRTIRDPFYIICGFGDTGSALVRTLTDHQFTAVVIDNNQDQINTLMLSDYNIYIPALKADATQPHYLQSAGLKNPKCAGVIAITYDDNVNLKIAITSKLLQPNLKVICRAEIKEIEANMASFGTDHIIDPFETFSDHLAMALHSPSLSLLYDWLTGLPNTELSEPLYPPHGRWILCGFGRFGRAVYKRLKAANIPVTIVEPNINCSDIDNHHIIGRGTEAHTLFEADITTAVGILAGTDNDTNNLSIIMTALELNPDLFVIARQNKRANQLIFDAAHIHLVMQPGDIIAHEIRGLLTAPLLSRFLNLALEQDNTWSNILISRIIAVIGDVIPYLWTVNISEKNTWSIHKALSLGRHIQLQYLLKDPRNNHKSLPCISLLLIRNNNKHLLVPKEDTLLKKGDKILFCGRNSAESQMDVTLQNINALNYVMTLENAPDSYIWRWFQRRLHPNEKRNHQTRQPISEE